METFCFIIALQIVIGLYIIPFFSLTRVYYYFVPSFIYAYETDSIQEINGLNKTRFIVLITLLFLSFFIGINGTKYILTYDSTEFSIISGLIIELLVLIFLFLQFFICISIEKKIPNSFLSLVIENLSSIRNILQGKNQKNKSEVTVVNQIEFKKDVDIIITDNDKTEEFQVESTHNQIKLIEYIGESDNINNIISFKNKLLLKVYNIKAIKLSISEIYTICNDNIDLFENVTHMHLFINLISSQFINDKGVFINGKVYLNAINSRKQNDKKRIIEFFRKFIEFEKLKAGRKSQNIQIEFLNKFFALNGNDIDPFNHKDSKYFWK